MADFERLDIAGWTSQLDHLRDWLSRVPFEPFRVRYADGWTALVRDPLDVRICPKGKIVDVLGERHFIADVAAIEPAGKDGAT
jgi:hypothetical protein